MWLATAKDSPGRFRLEKVGDGRYQVNLADPVVAALARSAGGAGSLRVFAECEGGSVLESIPIRYGLAKEDEPPLRIHIVSKGKRKALALRRIDSLASVLDREARGDRVGSFERWLVDMKGEDPGPDGWHRPREIDAIEVTCGARRQVEAQAGDVGVGLDATGDVQVLKLDDALRAAWEKSGELTLTCPVGAHDVPIALHAVPTELDLSAGLRLGQRRSADLPGSRGYLRVRIDDISGPRCPLTLTTAEGTTLIDDAILKEGDEARFDLGEHHYKLVVESLVNELIGDDYVRLVVREVPADEIARLASTRQRIEALLRAVEASDAVFLRSGKEYTGKEAAEHIRGKYAQARDVVRSVDDFIDRVAGASWTTGEEYKVRPKDGAEVGAKAWFREELKRIEG